MNKITFLLIACLTVGVYLPAQTLKFYQRDTSIKVFANGYEQSMPWCGGFNTPQFTMADVNNDGLLDMVVFENYNSLRTFLNVGTPGNPRYIYVPEYAYNFPPVYDYCIMADYNRDGVMDLFEQGEYGFAAYRGYINGSNQLCFDFYKNLFYTNDTRTRGYPSNAFDNPGDIPAIVDVDNDGDLDFIAYNIVGGNMNWYRNRQVEDSLPKDSIYIDLWDNCWGKVYQGFFRTHTLQYTCDNSMLLKSPRLRDTLAGAGVGDSTQKVTHSGNTPCLFDYDGDGDYDYLDGNISFNQMTFLMNGRIPYNPTGNDSMIYQDTMWQSETPGTYYIAQDTITQDTPGGVQINITQFAAAFNVDVDQDGKKDLLVAPNSTGLENYKCIWYYKNQTEKPGNPNWKFMSDTFMIDQSIDLGTASYPMLYDYNKDGLLDLFVSSDGYYQADGSLRAQISYYENTGSRGNPVFTLVTRDFMGISSLDFKGIAPAFGDIDGDGKDDMILGHSNGTLTYYKNMAASDSATPIWVLNELELTDNDGDTIAVNSHSAPFLYDINKDGKKDLVIGNDFGSLYYYQNMNTTPGTVNLQFVNTNLGNVTADPRNNFANFSTVYIGPIDSTGVDYLLMGANSGNIYEYTGFQSGDTSATYTMLDSQFSYIDSFDNYYAHIGQECGVWSNYRTSLTLGDVGGDGSYEMITGNTRGGCELYKWKARSTVSTPVIASSQTGSIKVFPNPTSNNLTVSWTGLLNPTAQINIINMEGKVYYTSTVQTSISHMVIPVSALPSGMYVCQLTSGANKYYSQFTVLRQ